MVYQGFFLKLIGYYNKIEEEQGLERGFWNGDGTFRQNAAGWTE